MDRAARFGLRERKMLWNKNAQFRASIFPALRP
jgi:hypothetical protein